MVPLSITREFLENQSQKINPKLMIRRLGIVPYLTSLDEQETMVCDRQAGRITDALLLLEHPHVITLGSGARHSRSHILVSSEELERRTIELHQVNRGGNVTYHGPGQLVGYPILDLKPDRCDVHRYVRDLEEVLIRTARTFGVVASRLTGFTGVWSGEKKLAAIGVRLSRWVTSHGFALNISTNLEYFNLIRPCGISNRSVTSLSALTGCKLTVQDVVPIVIREFCSVFQRDL